MRQKQFLILTLVFLILAGSLQFVNAQPAQQQGPIIIIFNLIQSNFGFLFTQQFLNDLIAGTGAAVTYIKFMLWTILFAILFFAGRKIFGDEHRNIAGVIAAMISLISVILIPKQFLLAILETYGAVATVFFLALPLVGLIFLSTMFPDTRMGNMVKAVIYSFVVVFLSKFTLFANTQENALLKQFVGSQWFVLMMGISVLVTVWLWIKTLRPSEGAFDVTALGRISEGGGGPAGGWMRRGVGRLFGRGRPTTPTGGETRAAERMAAATEAEAGRIVSFEEDVQKHIQNMGSALSGFATISTEELKNVGILKQKVADLKQGIGVLGDSYSAAERARQAIQAGAGTDVQAQYQRLSAEIKADGEKVQGILMAISGALNSLNSDIKQSQADTSSEVAEYQSIKNDLVSAYDESQKMLQDSQAKEQALEASARGLKPGTPESTAILNDIETHRNLITNLQSASASIKNTSNELGRMEMMSNDIVKWTQQIEGFVGSATDNLKASIDSINAGKFDDAVQGVSVVAPSLDKIEELMRTMDTEAADIKEVMERFSKQDLSQMTQLTKGVVNNLNQIYQKNKV